MALSNEMIIDKARYKLVEVQVWSASTADMYSNVILYSLYKYVLITQVIPWEPRNAPSSQTKTETECQMPAEKDGRE